MVVKLIPQYCVTDIPNFKIDKWQSRNETNQTILYQNNADMVAITLLNISNPPVDGVFSLKYTDKDGMIQTAYGMIIKAGFPLNSCHGGKKEAIVLAENDDFS